MPTGADLVASAARFLREPYSTAGGRCSQTSGYKDCSGLCSAALAGIGLYNACGNSTGLETWATRNGGRYVARDYAMRTPGLGVAIWGYGAQGHIGITAGGGNTIETPSAWGHMVGYSPMGHDRWGEWFTFPGISYDGVSPAPGPTPVVKRGSNQLIHVRRDANDTKGVWVYEGVRISPEYAFKLMQEGKTSFVEMGLVEFDRGLAGTQDPNNGIEDAPWFQGRIQVLRGNA